MASGNSNTSRNSNSEENLETKANFKSNSEESNAHEQTESNELDRDSKKQNQNSYSRTYDAHTTDDSDTDSNFRHRRSLLKHNHSKHSCSQNFNLHHRSQHSQQNKKNSTSSVSLVCSTNKHNKRESIELSTKKSCLVHRNSITSDEDNTVQTSTTISLHQSKHNLPANRSFDLSENQSTIQGILKQSSRDTSLSSRNDLDSITRHDLFENVNSSQKLPVINSLIIQWQQHQTQSEFSNLFPSTNNQLSTSHRSRSTITKPNISSMSMNHSIYENTNANQKSLLNSMHNANSLNSSFVPISNKSKIETVSSNLECTPNSNNNKNTELKRTISSANNSSNLDFLIIILLIEKEN